MVPVLLGWVAGYPALPPPPACLSGTTLTRRAFNARPTRAGEGKTDINVNPTQAGEGETDINVNPHPGRR